MARTMNESVLEMLEAIYTELKSIKKQLKPNNELKELKEKLSRLEARVTVLEASNIHQSHFTNHYPPSIMFDNNISHSSPSLPQVMGNSNTENISDLSKEIDSSMPGTFKVDENNNVKVPHIAKEFKKK